MKQVCVRLDDEIYKKLRVYCFTHGATLTKTLLALVNGLLSVEPPLTAKPKPVSEPKPAPDAFPELVEEPAKPGPVKIDPKNLDQYMAFPKSPKGKR